MKSASWQMTMHPEDKEMTVFINGQGLWQFTVMPFGPAMLQKLSNG
jgi:hypothetical protein